MLRIKDIENNCLFCNQEFEQYFRTSCHSCSLIKQSHFFGFELVKTNIFILDISFKPIKENYINYSNPSLKLLYYNNTYNFINEDLNSTKDLINKINKLLIFT